MSTSFVGVLCLVRSIWQCSARASGGGLAGEPAVCLFSQGKSRPTKTGFHLQAFCASALRKRGRLGKTQGGSSKRRADCWNRKGHRWPLCTSHVSQAGGGPERDFQSSVAAALIFNIKVLHCLKWETIKEMSSNKWNLSVAYEAMLIF